MKSVYLPYAVIGLLEVMSEDGEGDVERTCRSMDAAPISCDAGDDVAAVTATDAALAAFPGHTMDDTSPSVVTAAAATARLLALTSSYQSDASAAPPERECVVSIAVLLSGSHHTLPSALSYLAAAAALAGVGPAVAGAVLDVTTGAPSTAAVGSLQRALAAAQAASDAVSPKSRVGNAGGAIGGAGGASGASGASVAGAGESAGGGSSSRAGSGAGVKVGAPSLLDDVVRCITTAMTAEAGSASTPTVTTPAGDGDWRPPLEHIVHVGQLLLVAECVLDSWLWRVGTKSEGVLDPGFTAFTCSLDVAATQPRAGVDVGRHSFCEGVGYCGTVGVSWRHFDCFCNLCWCWERLGCTSMCKFC